MIECFNKYCVKQTKVLMNLQLTLDNNSFPTSAAARNSVEEQIFFILVIICTGEATKSNTDIRHCGLLATLVLKHGAHYRQTVTGKKRPAV